MQANDRADPSRTPGAANGGAPVEIVPATAAGLMRATLGAATAAALILTLFWLPAEYGVDPTGLGRVMGLTQMGEIKQQLSAEAAADEAAEASAAVAVTDPTVLRRLDAIEAQLAAIAAAVGAAPGAATAVADETTPADDAFWRDEVSYRLAPGEGVEVKLKMEAGAIAQFHWTANGAVLNHDTHGHGSGQRITYERGRAVAEQEDELVAAFPGNHGWFWRNRTAAPVTLTLRTRGDYAELRGP